VREQLRKSRRVAAALCLCGIAAGGARAQEPHPTLNVTAGLGGFVKAGRWAPVWIEIDHPSNAPSADLEVTWGDATVRRQLVSGSPGVRRFELFIRTADAGSVVRVALRSARGEGEEIVAEQPVTVLAHAVPVTLCVSGLDRWLADASKCTVVLPPHQLPGSVRGFDIVDEVLAAGDPHVLPESTRGALDRWRSVRTMEVSGDLSLTPQVTRPTVPRGLASASAPTVALFAGGYIGVLLLLGLAGATTRVATSWLWLAFAVGTIAAAGVALALGRVGPGAKVVVYHTSQLQQLAGATGSLLTLRGVAEFPSNDAVALRVPLGDAMLEPAAPSGRAVQVIDDAGYPTLSGQFGLGTRQAFAAEAVTDTQWLDVVERGDTVEISNRIAHPLHHCRFGDGMSVSEVGDLPVGATVTARRHGEVAGPMFTCTTTIPAQALVERSRVVEMRGTTTVAVYRDRRFGTNTTEVPND
jgi:hypothetical protein